MRKNMKVLNEWKELIQYYVDNPITPALIRAWDMLEPNYLCDTAHMVDENMQPTQEWLNMRAHGPDWDNPSSDNYLPFVFGGSTVSSFTNVGGTDRGSSPWNTAIDVFYQKTGRPFLYNPVENEAAKRAGHFFEDSVALAAREYEGFEDMKIRDNTWFMQHPVLPFLAINIDKEVYLDSIGEWILGEVKTTGPHNFETHRNWKDGIIPDYYEIQARVYMSITKYKKTLFMVKWGMTPDAGANVFLDRDLQIEADILNACVRMASYIVNDRQPDWESVWNDDLAIKSMRRVYGLKGNGSEVTLSSGVVDDFIRYGEIQKELKKLKDLEKPLKDEEKAIKARLLQELGPATTGTYVENGMIHVIEKSVRTSRRVDTKVAKELDKKDPTLGLYKETESERVKIETMYEVNE